MSSEESLLRILEDLVAFRSVSGDRSAALECLDYVETYLKKRGMKIRREESAGFPSLIATTHPTKRPKVLLQAHIDVVSAPDGCFKLKSKDGKLFGRGVFDMKFAAALFMQIADDLKDRLDDYDFGIMLTSDEEVGGENGVKALVKAGYGSDVCVLPDAGKDWKIETSHKGCWIGEIRAKGVAAHGSKPWDGDNAIYNLMEALIGIRSLFEGQHEDSDTMSVNRITGGSVVNQVADRAEATLDIRFVDDKQFDRMLDKISAVATKHGAEVRTVRHVHVSYTDIEHPLVLPFMRAVERIKGRSLNPVRSLGISDAHYFTERGIPVILSRPQGGGSHADGEWVDQADLLRYYEVVKAYTQEVAAQA